MAKTKKKPLYSIAKGWIYYVDFPEIDSWSNASSNGIYHIIDAPHVLAMNKNPRFQCCNCGNIIDGRPSGICTRCKK